jgi:hypothetical protein
VNSAVEDAYERQAVPPPLHKMLQAMKSVVVRFVDPYPNPDPHVFGPPGSGSGDSYIIKQKL